MTYTFHLREGVRFHNGQTMTADDVQYSINRVLAPKTASPFQNVFAVIKEVMVINPLYGSGHAHRAILRPLERVRVAARVGGRPAGDRRAGKPEGSRPSAPARSSWSSTFRRTT